MFVPLLIGLFSTFLFSIYFEITGNGFSQYKTIFDNNEEILNNKRNLSKNSIYKMKNIDKIRYLYKVIIFYLVIKYIKPEFNFINVFVPITFIYIFFNIIPVEDSHFGKKVNININYLLTFINIYIRKSSIIILYFIKKL